MQITFYKFLFKISLLMHKEASAVKLPNNFSIAHICKPPTNICVPDQLQIHNSMFYQFSYSTY